MSHLWNHIRANKENITFWRSEKVIRARAESLTFPVVVKQARPSTAHQSRKPSTRIKVYVYVYSLARCGNNKIRYKTLWSRDERDRGKTKSSCKNQGDAIC